MDERMDEGRDFFFKTVEDALLAPESEPFVKEPELCRKMLKLFLRRRSDMAAIW